MFIQPKPGAPHEHCGSVHAVDAEQALQNARDVYARRSEGITCGWCRRSGSRRRRLKTSDRSSIRRTTRPTGIRSSIRRRAACEVYDCRRDAYRDSAQCRIAQRSAPASSNRTQRVPSEYLLRLGDDRLILGHRLSEWCGHGPILEEDIALANIALDLIGQANLLLELAGKEEGQGRTADALAYFREGVEFRNALIMELPRGDFGFTIGAAVPRFRLRRAAPRAAAVVEAAPTSPASPRRRSRKTRYHVRHSADWMLKLGDGTRGESPARAERARRAVAIHRRAVRVGCTGAGPGAAGHRRRSRRHCAMPWRTEVIARAAGGHAHGA